MGAMKTLGGYTVVEVLVASAAFLLVVVVALETTTRLAVSDEGQTVYAVAGNQVDKLLREVSDGRHSEGVTTRSYDWGTVTTTIAPYRDGLQVADVTARITSGRKTISRRRIIEIDDEN